MYVSLRCRQLTAAALIGVLAAGSAGVTASSHREAPGITKTPKVDGTDFYMFRSYEAGRAGFVTLLANYIPLQDVYGGPNFFTLDDAAIYEIHVDNNGDAVEDLTFQFQATNTRKDLTVPVGDKMMAVPLVNIGPIGPDRRRHDNLNVTETYTLNLIRGARRTGARTAVTDPGRRPTARSRSPSIASATSRSRTTIRRSTISTRTITSTTSTFPAARRRAGACSSVSAAKASSSRCRKCST